MMASQHYDPALATATAQSLVFTNSPKIVRQEKDRVRGKAPIAIYSYLWLSMTGNGII